MPHPHPRNANAATGRNANPNRIELAPRKGQANGAGLKLGRPPRERANEIGRRLLDIAETMFLERGYDGTSMTLLAARAHIGKQTLYKRHPNKAALFREVVARRLDGVQIGNADENGPDPVTDLKNLGIQILALLQDRTFIGLHRIVIAEALAFPELANAVLGTLQTVFIERCAFRIARAQERGICKPADPLELGRHFFWSLAGDRLIGALCGVRANDGALDQDLETRWKLFLDAVLIRRP